MEAARVIYLLRLGLGTTSQARLQPLFGYEARRAERVERHREALHESVTWMCLLPLHQRLVHGLRRVRRYQRFHQHACGGYFIRPPLSYECPF